MYNLGGFEGRLQHAMQRVRRSQDIRWCSADGSPPPVGPAVALELIIHNSALARVCDLSFRDPEHFVAGEIHNHAPFWRPLLAELPRLQHQLFSGIINAESMSGISFALFTGTFRGVRYDAPCPPRAIFENANNCHKFEQFISTTILEWVQAGSVAPWAGWRNVNRRILCCR